MAEYINKKSCIKNMCKSCAFKCDLSRNPCFLVGKMLDYPASEVVEKEKYDHLLKIARQMYALIFQNTCSEQKVYDECGLTKEDNDLFGEKEK